MNSDLDPMERDAAGVGAQRVVADLSSTEFLKLLEQKDIYLEVRDGLLVVNAPAGVLDDLLRSELKRRKKELLPILAAPDRSLPTPLLVRPRGDQIPMTPSQQGMWLIDHFDPGNVAYNIPMAFVFHASLDLSRMQIAVDRMIARHEILRTSFHQENGGFFQVIADSVRAEIGFNDLSSLPENEAEKQGRALIREHAQRSFDLRQAPLVRFHCFRMQSTQDVLFINIHHILVDQQSLYVLREELMGCYRALEEGRLPELPPLTMQYADYASWLAQEMRGKGFISQVQYWKDKLTGLPPYLELPLRHAYPETRTGRGASMSFEVPSADREALAQIGYEARATPFMVFLALFGLLLARVSGKEDFCIGSPLTQRKHPETQRMLGLFMNMVPYRVQLFEQQSFRELLRQVRMTALEAFEKGDVPFQVLVRELRFNRRSPRTPIFQVMFGFEPYVPEIVGGFQVNTEPGTARYDLSMILSETGNGTVLGLFEYRTDLFEADEIRLLVDQFLWLVEAVRKDSDGMFFPAPKQWSAVQKPMGLQLEAVVEERGPSRLNRFSKIFSSWKRD